MKWKGEHRGTTRGKTFRDGEKQEAQYYFFKEEGLYIIKIERNRWGTWGGY